MRALLDGSLLLVVNVILISEPARCNDDAEKAANQLQEDFDEIANDEAEDDLEDISDDEAQTNDPIRHKGFMHRRFIKRRGPLRVYNGRRRHIYPARRRWVGW